MHNKLSQHHQVIARNIDAWIARLQSGKLKQARSVLRKRNGAMCCLGVAAEVLCEQGQTKRYFSSTDHAYRYDNSDTSLKKYELFGLRSQEGKAVQKKHASRPTLVGLNDSGEFVWAGRMRSVNFAYIAERLLLDLRTGDLGYFTTEARCAWLQYHGFAEGTNNG